jgi:hypothetical protein
MPVLDPIAKPSHAQAIVLCEVLGTMKGTIKLSVTSQNDLEGTGMLGFRFSL